LTHIKKVIILSVSKQTLEACISRPFLQRKAFVSSQKEVLALRYIAMELGVEIIVCQTIQGFVMLREPQNTFFQSNQTVSHQLITICSNSETQN
jgi:hypothetical protein